MAFVAGTSQLFESLDSSGDMTDVDLDDLYAQGDGDSQQQDEGQLAEAALPDSTAKDALTHEQLLEQLRCGSSPGHRSSSRFSLLFR
jgi:hypothetical protein